MILNLLAEHAVCLSWSYSHRRTQVMRQMLLIAPSHAQNKQVITHICSLLYTRWCCCPLQTPGSCVAWRRDQLDDQACSHGPACIRLEPTSKQGCHIGKRSSEQACGVAAGCCAACSLLHAQGINIPPGVLQAWPHGHVYSHETSVFASHMSFESCRNKQHV